MIPSHIEGNAFLIKTMFESVKKINDRIFIHFNNNGIFIRCIDYANVLLGEFVISKEKFRTYEVEKSLTFAINLQPILLYLRTVKSGNNIDITISKNRIIFNSNVSNEFIYNQVLDHSIIKIEPNHPQYLNFNTTITFNKYVNHNITNLYNWLKNFKDINYGKALIETKDKDVTFTIIDADDNIYKYIYNNVVSGPNSTTLYSLDYLLDVIKPQNDEFVIIELSTDYPLKLSTLINGVDHKYYLAPRIES